MKQEKEEEYKFKEYRSKELKLEQKWMKLKTGKWKNQWHQNLIIWKDNKMVIH